MRLSSFLTVILLISIAAGYKFFQELIPNGDQVVNPCDRSTWSGVGHLNPAGGGDRNAFGKAFKKAGKVWTLDLCKEDSDLDGRTNGEELGDPQCTWVKGEAPYSKENITHPGICEPMSSPHCKQVNEKIVCPKKWSCPAAEKPDITKLKIAIPPTAVPAMETTYICYNKKIPSDRLYDIVASKSLIDNTNVMHHMTMYGCTGDLNELQDGLVDNCELRQKYCEKKMLHIWAVGLEDFCQAEDRAVRFGKDLTTWVSIQYHWNNPQLVSNYTDSSGVELYYTANLRKYAVDIFQTGDGGIYIPPNSKEFKVHGLCSHECSMSSFDRTINLTSIILHMHGAGRRMWAKHYRNGRFLRLLAEDESYHYDRPVIHRFDNEPVVFEPGDELEIECTFSTEGNEDWVINGPGTHDEMCVTLISYYPANVFKVDNCFSVRGRCGNDVATIAPGCDLDNLLSTVQLHEEEILQACDTINGKTCSMKCNRLIGGIKILYPNCFDNQPVEVSRFMWASLVNINLKESVRKPVSNAFKGCELYEQREYLLPAM